VTRFAEHVEDYLRLRRSFGYKLDEHARQLPRFAAYLDAAGAEFVTLENGEETGQTKTFFRTVPVFDTLSRDRAVGLSSDAVARLKMLDESGEAMRLRRCG
jgi:hypothetical protein